MQLARRTMYRIIAVLFAAGVLGACDPPNESPADRATVQRALGGSTDSASPTCFVGGCSGQLCSAVPRAISSCNWKPHYACYSYSSCGTFGAGGACSWKRTAEFVSCMAAHGK